VNREPDLESAPRTLCEAFQRAAAVDPAAPALRTVDGGGEHSWGQYAARVRSIAAGLHALGVRPGDTVALMMVNRPEFHLCDTAILHLGATPFSIYNTSSPDQIEHLFASAGNQVVITESQFLDRLQAAGAPTVVNLGEAVGTLSLAELESSGDPAFDFEASWRAVRPDDLGTLIYTSGTTGPSKGVELTHAQLLAAVQALAEWLPVRFGDVCISFLPAAHIADRTINHYLAMTHGITVISVDNPRAVGAALPLVRPTIWGATPAVWQRIRAGLELALADGPAEVRDAVAAQVRRVEAERAGESVPAAAVDGAPLAALRERVGLDRVRWAACGAAPVPAETLVFFTALGVPIYEVWGMSETAGIATTNAPGHNRIGSVGRVVPGCAVKIDADGELLFAGPQVMRGYRGRAEATAEAIDAGRWLRTGDVARIDADGYVTIVDRKKEIIINAAGKNMSPANIETTIRAAAPLIAHAVAIGDRRDYVTALVVLDPEMAAAWAAERGRADSSASALAEDPEMQAAVAMGIQQGNAKLSRVEQVKRFRIVPDYWAPGGEVLTPTMKLRRRPIAERYAALIDELYAAAPPPAVCSLPPGTSR